MMPNVDGVTVLRSRRAAGLADPACSYSTAKPDTKDAVWCWELGADEYLNKPVDPDKLARRSGNSSPGPPSSCSGVGKVGLAEHALANKLEAASAKDAR